MAINQKLNSNHISPACKEVLEVFNKNCKDYLTIKEVSTALNISREASKNRLIKLVKKNKLKRIYCGNYCLIERLPQIKVAPFYIKMSKYFTISVPGNVTNLNNLKNKFVKIIVENNNKKHIFLTKTYTHPTSYQTFAFINTEIRDKLEIKPDDKIKILSIGRIFPFKCKEQMIYNNQVDLLSLIPEKTQKGFSFFVEEFEKDNEKWLNIWYYGTNCGSKNVWIKRFVNPEKLGSLLGIFQAEGTKFEEVKNKQSPRLIFTNNSLYEHKNFIDTLDGFGIPKNIIKADVFYNPNNASSEELKWYVNLFQKYTSIEPRVYIYTNNKKLYYGIQIMVERSALAELFLNAMNKIREAIANSELDGTLQKIGENFLAKLLTGDGCLATVRNKKKGHYRTQGYISEKNPKYREDYKKILRNFGVSPATWDDDGRVHFKCSNKNLRFLYDIEAFKGTKSWKKLISAFFYKQENKILYGRFKILNRLPDFTNKQYTDIFEVNRHASRVWINDKRMKGYIKISKTKGRKNYYILSDKAKDLLTFFDKRKLELQEF